ncbi:MAG: endonuclease/exonuclease/phosphatase family protein [Bacteroidota bacterium]
MKLLTNLLIFCNLLLVVATFGAFLSPFVSPQTSAIFPILGLLIWGLLAANIFFAVVWSWLQPKFAFFSLVTLILSIPSVRNMYAFNWSSPYQNTPKQLHVATYNTQFSKPLIHHPTLSEEVMTQQFSDFLSGIDHVDILGVQECGWRTDELIDQAMQFPYRHFIPNIYTGIYSKLPIINQGTIKFNNSAKRCLWADLTVNKDTIRVYVAHLEPNRSDGKIPIVMNQEAKETISYRKLAGIVQHQAIFSRKRTEQAQMIRAHQATSPYPSIIMGDFNDIPQTFTYSTVSQSMKDTFLEKGFGLGTTHSKLDPLLRIDYLLVDATFSVVKHKIHKVPFSDHYLVEGAISF